MNWQEQRRQAYERQKAVKEQARQQADEEQHSRLKKQFEEQQRRAIEQVIEREGKAEEQRHREVQQHTSALQRIADDLKRSNEQREIRLQEAQKHLKQLQSQEQRVWIGWDGKRFRSPGEKVFWDAWKSCGYQEKALLLSQYQIGRYYVDFCHVESTTIIEVDGRAYHTSRYAFTHDRVRERALKKLGWNVIRFSNDEISCNVEECVLAAYEFISTLTHRDG